MTDVVLLGFGVVGAATVLLTTSSVVRTLLVPRGQPSKVANGVAVVTRTLARRLVGRRTDFAAVDGRLALVGPILLLELLLVWLVLYLVGWSLVLLAWVGSPAAAVRETASSMLTLGIAATPGTAPTVVNVLAGLCGFGLITLQIAYLPTLYAAFNRRETTVTMLESRAGSPPWGPEILVRHLLVGVESDLPEFYTEWERWSADVAESHASYPMLMWFRSPHPLRSWIVGLLSVLDAAAIHLAVAPRTAPAQARLCLRMGFTALRDLAEVARVPYDPDPHPDDPIELTYEAFAEQVDDLRRRGLVMQRSAEDAWPHFRGWRVNYESIAYALCDQILAPPAPWSGPRRGLRVEVTPPDRPPHRDPDRDDAAADDAERSGDADRDLAARDAGTDDT